jgi:tetrahydromethanopterin S-methyltransferase subunit B
MNAADLASALTAVTSRLRADARELLLLDAEHLQNRVQQLHDAVQDVSTALLRRGPLDEDLKALHASHRELRRAAATYRIIVEQALAQLNALLNATRYSRGLHDQER